MADYLEKKYFHRYGFSEGGKEWGEMRFDWIPTVNEWRPYNEDDPLAEDDLELFIEEKEYELVNQMLDDENSRLHKFFINNPRYVEEEEFETNYKVLNEDGEIEKLGFLISWGEPDIQHRKSQYSTDPETPLYRFEFLNAEEVPLALKIPRRVICDWCEDTIQKSPMLVPSMSDKLALVCSQECADDISGLSDQDANESIKQDFERTINVEKYQSEDQSAYWFLKGEMQSRAPLNKMDLEQILEMLQNVPAKEMNEAMEQAEMFGDEAAMIVLVMADNKRKFREEYASEYVLLGTMQSTPADGYNGYMKMMRDARKLVEIGNETGLDQKLGEAYQDESGRWFLPILERKASEDEPSVEKLKSYFSRLKSQNPDLARKIEFSVKNEEELPTEEIEKAGFQEDKIEEWVDLVGVEDENLQPYESCPACEGEGIVITNYYPATRYDPADADFEECEDCYGSGEIDPAYYMDKDGNYMAESWQGKSLAGSLEEMDEMLDRKKAEKYDDVLNNPYFMPQKTEGERQLELAIKRTKMSAIRTGLAITTFGIVMLNLWINRKQSQQIDNLNKKD